MTTGARTPEELDTLLEDAFVVHDGAALGQLFEEGAVFADARGGLSARGGEAIGRALGELWAEGGTYVAGPCCVLQARDTALVLGDGAIHVARRGGDGIWRAAIALLPIQTPDIDPNGGLMTDQQMTPLQPVATHRGAGEARWWFGALAEIKLTAAQTGGALTIVEITEPPGSQAPLHVHERDDETFWILDGDLRIEVGGTTLDLSAGDVAFGPKGVPHRYTAGDAGCRMLFIMTPGGLEDLVRGMSVPARSRTLPPADDGEPDWDNVASVAKANHCELLG